MYIKKFALAKCSLVAVGGTVRIHLLTGHNFS